MASNKYLIKAKDDFQIDSFIYRIVKDHPDHVVKKYYDVNDLIEKITSESLFKGNQEISVLMDLDASGVKVFDSCLQELHEDPIVLIQRKAISKTKAYSNLTVDFEVKKLDSLKTSECVRWVANTLKSRDIKHSKGVPDYMVNAVGLNQYALLNEIDKISLISNQVSLSTSNISHYIASANGVDYFSFIDHLTHLRLAETLEEFDKIDSNSYFKLIGFIISQLERFYKISIYRSQKYSPEEIGDIIGIPAFILKTKIFTIYSFLPKVKILKALDIFSELSEKLRSSKYNKKALFESYLLKVFKL